MKKALALICLAVLSILFFAAQTSGAIYKDGVYRATFDFVDGHGWKPWLEITIKAGKVVAAKFDYVNPEGKMKTADTAYATTMKSRTGISPAEASAELEKRFLAKQALPIDVVTGASASSANFNALAKAILVKAAKGDMSPTILPMNDTYTAQDKPDERGYTGKIAITFENGKIVAVVYNEFDKNNVQKRGSSDYNIAMKAKMGVSWLEAVTKLEAAFLLKQGPAGVDVVTGATSASRRFLALAQAALATRR